VIPAEFSYHAPTSVVEAIELLERLGDDAKLLAGGQSLIPAMRFRLSTPAQLVDLNAIPSLAHLTPRADHLAIGALTREFELEASDCVEADYPMLLDAARVIADPLVRNRATVGGNLAHADPANDHPAVMLAYGAHFVARGPAGERSIEASDFFTGLFENALEPNELLTEIRIPKPRSFEGGAYVKFERKVGDYAIAAAAVQLALDGDRCTEVRIALTNVSPVPMRAFAAEERLRGFVLTPEVIERAGQSAAEECDPSPDLRGSIEYKRDLTRIVTKRAIAAAKDRAEART